MRATFFNTKRALLAGGLLAFLYGCDSASEQKALPNIIYILTDDLGYGETGAYGQSKIETPHIDKLAASGMRFTQHYASAPVCAPDRCMLLTGMHAGHAYIRGNDEWAGRGNVWDYRSMVKDSTLEGQMPMPENTVTFPMKLKQQGYTTAIIGKWGLGAPQTKSIPNELGFDYFFGYNCQRMAHTYYPTHLWENRVKYPLANDTLPPHSKLPPGADPKNPDSYNMFSSKQYAPEVMFEKLQAFVEANKDRPFFLYWATPLPHVPLQVPKKWADYYAKKFGAEPPYLGESGYFPSIAPKAAYAAMISYMDEQLGQLIRQLKDSGIYENTLIIFSSDNGPSYAGGAAPDWFESAKPFRAEYGRGKGFVYEGGIRVPMIAVWEGHIKPGSETDLISAQYDVFPTLGELTGFQATGTDGISFLPTLLSAPEKQKPHSFLYWEFPENDGQLAVRMGDWKLVAQHLKEANKTPALELYNLKEDPTESRDVAAEHPEIVEQIKAIVRKEHVKPENANFDIPVLDEGL